MRRILTIFVVGMLMSGLSISEAAKGVLATDEDVAQLKKDVKEGVIKVGKTRLSDVRSNYGEAPSISDASDKVTYEYPDMRLTFEKKRIWTGWEYDSFRATVYTDSVDDLRFDLESNDLVGKNITYTKVRKDYGEPTESEETTEDGEFSVYYYGNIRMIFENVTVLSSWRGNMGEEKSAEKSPTTTP